MVASLDMRQEMAYLLELCGFEPVEEFSGFPGICTGLWS
jgi:hypothetical protein